MPKNYFQEAREDTQNMEIVLKGNNQISKQNENSSLDQFNKSQSRDEIFGKGFMVQPMDDPSRYLPRYQQNQQYEKSCIQECNICCGNLCINFAYCCAVLCCCKCAACVYELPTSKAGLVEEFGKFSRLLKPGINMINPCSQQVTEVDLKIKMISCGQGQFITKDNVKLVVRTSLAYRIINPITAHYVLGSNIERSLAGLAESSFRNVIGQQILDEVLSNRAKIVGQVNSMLLQKVQPGIRVERLFMEDIQIPRQTVKDLSSAARQRRISEANIINSQADVQTAKLLKQSAQLLDTKAAMQIRYLQMVQNLGKNKCKLMLPIGIDKKGFKN